MPPSATATLANGVKPAEAPIVVVVTGSVVVVTVVLMDVLVVLVDAVDTMVLVLVTVAVSVACEAVWVDTTVDDRVMVVVDGAGVIVLEESSMS